MWLTISIYLYTCLLTCAQVVPYRNRLLPSRVMVDFTTEITILMRFALDSSARGIGFYCVRVCVCLVEVIETETANLLNLLRKLAEAEEKVAEVTISNQCKKCFIIVFGGAPWRWRTHEKWTPDAHDFYIGKGREYLKLTMYTYFYACVFAYKHTHVSIVHLNTKKRIYILHIYYNVWMFVLLLWSVVEEVQK